MTRSNLINFKSTAIAASLFMGTTIALPQVSAMSTESKPDTETMRVFNTACMRNYLTGDGQPSLSDCAQTVALDANCVQSIQINTAAMKNRENLKQAMRNCERLVR